MPGDSPALPTTWVSTDDGQSWDEVVIFADPKFQRSTSINDIAVTDTGFLAVGVQAGPGPVPVLLFSEDAVHWEIYRSPGIFHDLNTLGNDIVALDLGGDVFVWSAT